MGTARTGAQRLESRCAACLRKEGKVSLVGQGEGGCEMGLDR